MLVIGVIWNWIHNVTRQELSGIILLCFGQPVIGMLLVALYPIYWMIRDVALSLTRKAAFER
jgi:hypothetical protein